MPDDLTRKADAGPDEPPGPAAAHPGPGPLPCVPGYEVLGELGRGGMGVVYKALHLRLKRVAALKVLHPSARPSSGHRGQLLARFRREAEALARLRHPHIVEIHEVGETADGAPYLALEFCPGGSLAALLRPAPLQPAVAAALVRALAGAVEAAHAAGVIHRDLKPANILLQSAAGKEVVRDLGPKVTDFSLARVLDEAGLTQAGEVMGTPSYMAPEQADGRGHEAGPPADVWALGAVLYECLTGRPPFMAASVWDTLRQVLHDDPAPPRRLNARVPTDLDTVCLKCLHKDPARRYAGAQALGDDLGRWLDGRPIQARRVGPLGQASRWARRRPALLMLVAALLVLLAAGALSLAAWQRAESRRRAEQQANRHEARERAGRLEGRAEVLRHAARLGQPGAFLPVAAALREALEAFPPDPDPGERLLLQERWAAADLLAGRHDAFLQQSRAAWFFAGEEEPPAARLACRRALAAFGVLGQERWWLRPPADGLTDAQQKELRDEVYRLLLLAAALHVQEAIGKFTEEPERHAASRQAQGMLARARAMERAGLVPPCRTAALLEKGAALLGKGPPRRGAGAPVRAEFRDDVDGFFLGVLHLFLGTHGKDPVTQIVGMLGPKDFDFRTPLPTARRLLRRAVRANPEQYWAWFMLGRALSLDAGRAEAAGLAFDACVLLRPDYSRGYEQRARAAVLRATATPDPAARAELLRGAQGDIDRGAALAPLDPSPWWVRGEMERLQGRDRPALLAYAHALLLEDHLFQRVSRRNLLAQVRSVADRLARQDSSDADARVVGALLLLNAEQDHAAQALGELDAVLRDRPGAALALLARGRALERQAASSPPAKQRALWQQALAAYQRALGQSAPWQKDEARRGRERVGLRLGVTQEVGGAP
jgi:hypothetical protein